MSNICVTLNVFNASNKFIRIIKTTQILFFLVFLNSFIPSKAQPLMDMMYSLGVDMSSTPIIDSCVIENFTILYRSGLIK